MIVPSERDTMCGLLLSVRATVREVQTSGQNRNVEKEALPLLLLPGTFCDARVFGPLQERLAGVETRVVLTPQANSISEAADQLLAEAPEHFALLGYSLGGMVAMEATLCAPERVLALALVSTTPLPVPAERHSARRAAVDNAHALGPAQFVREHLWPEYAGTAPCSASLLPLLETMAESLGHTVFARQTEMALARQDYRSRLAAVTCPSLVVAGADDRLCLPETQRQLAAALGGCPCVLVPSAGHLALLEHADEVASAVAAWFQTATQLKNKTGGDAADRVDLKESE